MKTFSPKKKEMTKKWYIIDAEGVILGKLAVSAANILRGKQKASFAPFLDCGDNLIIVNAAKVKVSGNKLEDKKYYSHSWYPGGLRTRTLKEVQDQDPCFVIKNAVVGMLPKNELSKEIIKKLKIFPGSEHNHTAQSPEEIKVA